MIRQFFIFLAIVAAVAGVYRLLVRLRWVRHPERLSQVRLTREGKIFLLFTLLVLLSALHTGVNLIYLTFSVLASALLLSYALVLIAQTAVHARRELPLEVTAGQPFWMTLTLANRSSWAPIFCLSIQHNWPEGLHSDFNRHLVLRLSPGREEVFRVPVMAERRGRYVLPEFRFGTRFPFGFFEHVSRAVAACELVALPRLGVLSQMRGWDGREGQEYLKRRTLRGGRTEEFFGLREYRPGDNLSWIHWRTSARQQQLIVREYAAHDEQTVLLVLNSVVGSNGEEKGEDAARLELAISFTATLARELCLRNYSVAVAAYSPRPHYLPFDQGRRHWARVWRELALLEPASKGGPEELLSARGLPSIEHAVVVLITLSGLKADVEGACRQVRRQHGGTVKTFDVNDSSFGGAFWLPPLTHSLLGSK